MQKISYIILCFFILYFSRGSADSNFGYINYHSYNIGDDIQAIAAKRFLPENSIGIDREFIGVFTNKAKVNTIVNGWYMHTKKYAWYRKDVPAPEKSWPPSPFIKPIFIAIHFTKDFIPEAFTQEGINYLKEHSPVGARDYQTLKELQKRNIPSYFSGCLTLTLENTCSRRDDIIYAVDIDEECVQFIRSKTKYKVEVLTHIINEKMSLNDKARLQYTEETLEKYKRAKCVITTRLHASMPCLALKTPVLLIDSQNDPRFDGLRELTRHCSKKELINKRVDFNFDDPPENPKLYIPIRENLIKTLSEWVSGILQSNESRG
ncbi:MAG: polysaccharide pyruvyl transferase family protein [Chlamydiae bacterium]|nr:polysaccharide pyruvyl transferase family protein [Chlamydiota bacterium]